VVNLDRCRCLARPMESGHLEGDNTAVVQISNGRHTFGHIRLFDANSSTMILGDLAANEGGPLRAPAQFTEDPAQ